MKELKTLFSRWNEFADASGLPVIYSHEISEYESVDSSSIKSSLSISVQAPDFSEMSLVILHKVTRFRHKKQWFEEEGYLICGIAAGECEAVELHELVAVPLDKEALLKEILVLYQRMKIEDLVEKVLGDSAEKA